VRGEHCSAVCFDRSSFGSSPRAWGTRIRAQAVGGQERFIPTCVGNTLFLMPSGLILSVHPHVRGEHNDNLILSFFNAGSSPRAWGTLHLLTLICSLLRFIPTCAGNTAASCFLPSTHAVHPHVRGEHPPLRLTNCGPARFIPTCVGNTVLLAGYLDAQTVHPHVRGEHVISDALRMDSVGSSPRAWGTQ